MICLFMKLHFKSKFVKKRLYKNHESRFLMLALLVERSKITNLQSFVSNGRLLFQPFFSNTNYKIDFKFLKLLSLQKTPTYLGSQLKCIANKRLQHQLSLFYK